MQPTDILILSNGPGEISTWVLPVVQSLRRKFPNEPKQVRISVVLSPCPNATGFEAAIASSFPEVDRVLSSEHFFAFLLWGKLPPNWDWYPKGIVLFLGGDQFYALLLGRRLGYKTLIYAEWQPRWYQWLDRFGVVNNSQLTKVPDKYRHKLTVVGDLMVDLPQGDPPTSTEYIGIFPGSKPAKLAQGLPLTLAIAAFVAEKRPQTRFILPLAPTLDLDTLVSFANPLLNPILPLVNGKSAVLVKSNSTYYLQTTDGLQVELITQFPAYEQISQCCLCLTTVGANTAQLSALGVPMIVLLPTHQLDAMRSWDGLPGILANLPGFGAYFAKLINWLVLKQNRLFAWPNIWAKAQIVPELVGNLQPEAVGSIVLDYLEHPEQLAIMRSHLLQVSPPPGAVAKLVNLVAELLNLDY
jgi:lipid-A-disaccharide synthase